MKHERISWRIYSAGHKQVGSEMFSPVELDRHGGVYETLGYLNCPYCGPQRAKGSVVAPFVMMSNPRAAIALAFLLDLIGIIRI